MHAAVVVLDPAGRPVSGTLTCSIQVGYFRHADPDVAATSASGTGAVVLAAPLSYRADQPVLLSWCTQFAYDGGPTLYWVPRHRTPEPAHWTTDPNAPCDVLTDEYRREDEVTEQVACPVLRALGGALGLDDPDGAVYVTPEGDTYVAGTFVWDCWPYE